MRQRVVLTPVATESADFIADIKSNAELWPYETDINPDKAAALKTVTDRIGSDWYRQYVIRLDDASKTPIGEFHIHRGDVERKCWEIGYCLLPQYRGMGYCTEAAAIMLEYAFTDLRAHKVVAMCNEFNAASRYVMQKIGMKKEAVFREELPWKGEWANQLFYSILDHEYACIRRDSP